MECETAPGEDNLVAQALRSLEEATGWAIDGLVRINKGIPTGAGLGGGSSDAVAALRAGEQAIVAAGGAELGADLLRVLARGVGADVPFFLRPEPSFARGVGEVLEPVRLPSLPLVLVFNEAPLSTADVYKEFDRITAGQARPAEERPPAEKAPVSTGNAPSPTEARPAEAGAPGFADRARVHETSWRALAAGWGDGRLETGQILLAIAAMLENELEMASFRLLPGLAEDRSVIIEQGALGAAMSGSGPTLFGLCVSASAADQVAERLAARGFRVCRATALTPL